MDGNAKGLGKIKTKEGMIQSTMHYKDKLKRRDKSG